MCLAAPASSPGCCVPIFRAPAEGRRTGRVYRAACRTGGLAACGWPQAGWRDGSRRVASRAPARASAPFPRGLGGGRRGPHDGDAGPGVLGRAVGVGLPHRRRPDPPRRGCRVRPARRTGAVVDAARHPAHRARGRPFLDPVGDRRTPDEAVRRGPSRPRHRCRDPVAGREGSARGARRRKSDHPCRVRRGTGGGGHRPVAHARQPRLLGPRPA